MSTRQIQTADHLDINDVNTSKLSKCTSPIVIMLFLTGCGVKWFVPPDHDPVIEDRIQRLQNTENPEKIGTLAVTPERRLFIVNLDKGTFCAEYPTEVGLSAASIAQFVADIKSPEQKAAAISALMATERQNQSLNRRSQAVQYLLAASYFQCQLLLNAITDPKGIAPTEAYSRAEEQYSKIGEAAKQILLEEIKYFHESQSSMPDFVKDARQLSEALGALNHSTRSSPESTVQKSTKKSQEIAFSQPASQVYASGGTLGLVALATSDLPVTFASLSIPVCTVKGATVTMVSIGTCEIIAIQKGNDEYKEAEKQSRKFEIKASG